MSDEVARHRLLDRIRERWQHPVTVLVAGAGFGKSTLIAQAIRDNAVAPRGIDVWYACVPGDENADRLGAALLQVLGSSEPGPDVVAFLAEALGSYSPIDVCLTIDDAHLLTPGSSGAELLGALVRRLPANAHLLLAARRDPPGALTRLRAADRLLRIDEQDLAFDATETRQISARFGRRPDEVAALGGWPALVRLALAVAPDVALGFAQEEVLGRLTGPQCRAVFALANLGYADRDLVGRVVGGDVDLQALADAVPLISRTEQGLFRAHELWSAAAAHVLDPHETAELRGQLIDHLVANGQVARAGAIAVAHGDVDRLSRVAMQTVTRTVSVLPLDTVRPWLEILERDRPARAETLLLSAAIRQATDFADTLVDREVDRAAELFRANADHVGEVAALAVGTVAAHSRDDLPRTIALAERGTDIPGALEHPVVDLAVHSMAAVVAEMSGEPERALAELRRSRPERAPAGIATAVHRFLLHCLLLTGRADEAAEVADLVLGAKAGSQARTAPALAHWMAGDPTALLAVGGPTIREPGLSSRDEFVRRPTLAHVLACHGRRDDLAQLVRDAGHDDRPACATNARDAVLAAVTGALAAVLDHDDVRAGRAIAAVAAAFRESPVVEQHLRRFLPVVYVLDRRLRARWDKAQLGPSHARSRRTARLLVDLRAGVRVDAAGLDPAQVFTALPLPWSVELACRLHADGDGAGLRLATWLVDRAADGALAELRRLACDARPAGPRSVPRAANDLLSRLPSVPDQRLEISVLGPLRVSFGGVPVAPAALRRARVRTLLALLVVHRTVSRDRVIDLLWPDLDPADGARNLRVTLTYLRQLVEPDRLRGEASFHLRADGTTISLHASEHLQVDLWELQRACREASCSREEALVDRAITLLEAGTALWRGQPLSDLAMVDDHEVEVERARLLHLGALLDLGELQLTRGRAAESLVAAERALELDPYSERAHCLAVSAALHTRDRARTATTARRLLVTLKELGVQPAPATRILLRQAR